MPAMTDLLSPVMAWEYNPPAEVLESRMLAAGGYMLVSGLFDEATLDGLLAEAEAVRPEGIRQYVPESDGSEGRGGSPGRSFRSAGGRDLHWGLHGSPEMAAALRGLCGATLVPSGSGTYTYYEQPGDFLALHRDILQCDVAIITALTPHLSGGLAGGLMVYDSFIREPLSTVRAAGRAYGRPIMLERGHTIVLLGGLVPHEVTPTCEGQERIVAVNCFRIETAGDRLSQEVSQTAELACR